MYAPLYIGRGTFPGLPMRGWVGGKGGWFANSGFWRYPREEEEKGTDFKGGANFIFTPRVELGIFPSPTEAYGWSEFPNFPHPIFTTHTSLLYIQGYNVSFVFPSYFFISLSYFFIFFLHWV